MGCNHLPVGRWLWVVFADEPISGPHERDFRGLMGACQGAEAVWSGVFQKCGHRPAGSLGIIRPDGRIIGAERLEPKTSIVPRKWRSSRGKRNSVRWYCWPPAFPESRKHRSQKTCVPPPILTKRFAEGVLKLCVGGSQKPEIRDGVDQEKKGARERQGQEGQGSRGLIPAIIGRG